MSFTKKLLSFQFSLASGVFDGGGNSKTISNVQASVKVTNAGPPSMGILSADIYGLSLSTMNQLTTLGTQVNLIGQNSIVVQAGESDSSGNPAKMATVFQGTIDVAFCNAQAMPEVAFHVEAHAGAVQAVKPMDPTSVKGSADVSQVMSQIAQQLGLSFEDGGVQSKISNPYLWGSGRNQVLALAKAAGVNWEMDNASLAIWPSNGSRQSAGQITISPQTGMVGYPAFNQAGIVVRVLFDPTAAPLRGANITVQSDLTPACGTWNVVQIEYSLQSLIPRGDWFAILNAVRTGEQQVV